MIAVAGGGPAGAAVACLLAKAGHEVTLVERETEATHKICGEFLSLEALHYLVRLGVDPRLLGARTIWRVRLVRGGKMVDAALPFIGMSLTRRSLDEALLRHAASLGVTVLRGHAVRGVEAAGLDVSGHGLVEADAVFLATGKHELRGQQRVVGETAQSDLIGFKGYFAVSPAAAEEMMGYVEIMLFPGGYAGLQIVESGLANLCLLVDQACFAEAGRSWDGVLDKLKRSSPHLCERLAGAEMCLERPLTIARVPYGFLHLPSDADPATMFRLGDQIGVIPSFAGDGIAIALYSAHVAAGMFLDGMSADAYHRRVRQELRAQLAFASFLQRSGRNRFSSAVLFAACRVCPPLVSLMAKRTRVKYSSVVKSFASFSKRSAC